MPRKFIFLISLLVTIFVLHGQNWCPQGATWHYEMSGGPGGGMGIAGIVGGIKYTYTKDTVVNTVACKIISGVFTGSWYSKAVNNSTLNVDRFVTYESNRVLYLFNGTGFDTVVDYKAKPGDRWLRPRLKNGCVCTSLLVTDTSSQLVNGIRLKKIKTAHTYSYTLLSTVKTETVRNTCMERVYNSESDRQRTFNPLFLLYQENEWNVDGPYYRFLCYSDNTFAAFGNGCATLDVSETKAGPLRASVYPNPCTVELTIDLPDVENNHYRITDISGRVLRSDYVKGTAVVNVSLLESGVYFLQLHNDDGLFRTLKFVKEQVR